MSIFKLPAVALILPPVAVCSLGAMAAHGQSGVGEVISAQKIGPFDGGFTGDLEAGDLFGRSAANLGDLDGDGVVDVAVGASRADEVRGVVWILFLRSDGTVRSHQKIGEGSGGFLGDLDGLGSVDAPDFFGGAVVSLGDMDGDGNLELAVSAQGDDDGGADHGAIWILSLRPDGTVSSQKKISEVSGGFMGSLGTLDRFGRSMDAADLDGDGVLDLVVGAPGDDDGGLERGAVWILYLESDATVRGHAKVSAREGGFGGSLNDVDWFGSAVAAAEDFDSNGIPDLMVGAQGTDSGGTGVAGTPGAERGSVWHVQIDAAGRVLSETKIGTDSGGFVGDLLDQSLFGCALAWLGDLDGDGVGDLAVGALGDYDGSSPASLELFGAIWILFLRADGTVKGHQKISATSGGFPDALSVGSQLGSALGSLGDLDGDGIGDLLAGAWGDGMPAYQGPGACWVLFLNAGVWSAEGDGLEGASGVPVLSGFGSLVAGQSTTLALAKARPQSSAFLITGARLLDKPLLGGVLVPSADSIFAFDTGSGAVEIIGRWPEGLPSDTGVYFQSWILDPSGPFGYSASNGLKAMTP